MLRFPREELEKRVRRVRKEMEKRGIDLLVVFSSPGSMRYGQRGHVMYLSGYEPYFGNNMLILPMEKNQEPLLQIDQADYFPSQFTWIANTIQAQDPIKTIREYLRETKIGSPRIGIVGEYSIPPQLLDRLNSKLKTPRIRIVSDLLENERAVKSEYEIKCIRRASGIAKIGFEAAAEFANPGVAECEIVGEIERACRTAGSEYFPHHTMVSSGSDEKYLEQWWYCSKRRLRKKDTWNMDFGTMYKGYCCDIARSFFVGRTPKKLRDLYQVLVDAEIAGQKAARPGVLGSEVNEAVIEVMTETFEGDFSGIGHGVGLEVHEWPFVGYQYIKNDPIYKDSKLKENMVISIEPQVYQPEIGHIQIEDEFLVTKSGGKKMNNIPREIFEC